MIVTLLDILKGVLPVLAVGAWGGGLIAEIEYLKLAVGAAAILGHIFPIYIGFRGGKGVNTALGVFITILPLPTLIAMAVFILIVSVSRYISLGSVLAAIALAAVVVFFRVFSVGDIHTVYIPTSLLLMVLIIFTHRSNLKRLFRGTENKFSFHSRAVDGAKSNG